MSKLPRREWWPALTALTLGVWISCAGCSASERPATEQAVRSAQLPLWPSSTLQTGRIGHAATLLKDGRVLVCGGVYIEFDEESGPLFHYLNTCELYLPGPPASWSASQWPALPEERAYFTLTTLPDGSVLAVGGMNADGSLASARVGTSQGWRPEEPIVSRYGHTASLLDNGKVLVVGGHTTAFDDDALVGEAELRDAAGSWHSAGNQATAAHSATVLGDGAHVLVVGGEDQVPNLFVKASLFSEPDVWQPQADLPEARSGHTATLLESGEVLVVGGQGAAGAMSKALRFAPAQNRWSDAGSTRAIFNHSAGRVGRNVLVVGGQDESQVFDTVSRFDPDASPATAFRELEPLGAARSEAKLVPLDEHRALVIAGVQLSVFLNSAELVTLPCGESSDCKESEYCAPGGICSPKKDIGTACGASGECAAGLSCTDGVCCESECGGQCQTCNAAGRCVTVMGEPVGRAPCASIGFDAACAPSCNGDPEKCTFPAMNRCSAAACSADGAQAVSVGSCDGKGHCEASFTECGPYVCADDHCADSCGDDGDCAKGYVCRSSRCVVQPRQGDACAADVGCADDLYCLDGVCCTQAACASGSSCALGDGECRAATTVKLPNGDACERDTDCESDHCAGDATRLCCESTCDGACESCALSGHEGSCLHLDTPECQPGCERDEDCGSGERCVSRVCTAEKPAIGDPNSGGMMPGSTSAPKSPAGCTRSADCDTDYTCMDGECVMRSESTKAPDTGCSFRPAPDKEPELAPGLALFALLASRCGRRRRAARALLK